MTKNFRTGLCVGAALWITLAGCTTRTETNNPSARTSQTPAMPALGAQLDRAGRVAVSTGLIHTFDPDPSTKTSGKLAFNTAAPNAWAEYKTEAAKNLAIWDGLDTQCGNQLIAAAEVSPQRYEQLATVLMDDQIYLDASRGTCGQYLGLEAEAVGALPKGEGACGGRTPLDDVIGATYSVLAAGALSGIDTTLTGDGAAHNPAVFPFLARPPE